MIRDGERELCVDTTVPLLHLLGKRYGMLILGVLSAERSVQFNGIVAAIPHSNSTIISKTLRDMVELGVITKESTGSRIRYTLTPFGNELRKSVMPLLRFAADQTVNRGQVEGK